MINQNLGLFGDWLLGEQWMTLVQPRIPQLINVRNLARAPAETRRAAFCTYDSTIIFYRQDSQDSLQMGHSLLEEHTKHFGTSMIFLVAASDTTSDLADIRTAQLVQMAKFSERGAHQLLDIVIGSHVNHRYVPEPPPQTPLPEPPISPTSRPSTPRAARTKRSHPKLKSDRSIGQSSGALPMDSFERDWNALLTEIKSDEQALQHFVSHLVISFLIFLDARELSRFRTINLRTYAERHLLFNPQPLDPRLLPFLCYVGRITQCATDTITVGMIPSTVIMGELRSHFVQLLGMSVSAVEWAAISPDEIHGILLQNSIQMSFDKVILAIRRLSYWPGLSWYWNSLWHQQNPNGRVREISGFYRKSKFWRKAFLRRFWNMETVQGKTSN